MFRGEDFLKLANQKQELPVVAMFGNYNGSYQNVHSLREDLPTKFHFIWPRVFRGED
jgi:hypothetical protein